jgi:hypothetical protein
MDRIEKDMRSQRPDSDLDRWILANKAGVRLYITETVSFAPAPSVGTCPLVAWHKEAFGMFPGLFTRGIYNCRSIAGSSSPSQHSYANAEDPAHDNFATMQAMFNWMVENADRLDIEHVIFNRKIWSRSYGYIRPYTGDNPHIDHVHVDFRPNLSGSCRASQCG